MKIYGNLHKRPIQLVVYGNNLKRNAPQQSSYEELYDAIVAQYGREPDTSYITDFITGNISEETFITQMAGAIHEPRHKFSWFIKKIMPGLNGGT